MSTDAPARYAELTKGRRQFEIRAQHNALLTLPALYPLDGHKQDNHLVEPYSSLGGAGVEHLASRLTVALVPAGRAHLRFEPSPRFQLNAWPDGPPQDVVRQLATMEQLVRQAVEAARWRSSTMEAMLQMIISGNALEEYLDDNTIRVFRLDSYVCRRDYRGDLAELLLKEEYTEDNLPDEAPRPEGKSPDEPICIYTWIRRDGKKYTRQQFVESAEYHQDSFSLDSLPYNALRFQTIPGEDYGRSRVETIAADLRALETAERGMVDICAMTARNFLMIRPGGLSAGLRRQVIKAANGDAVIGDPDGVELKSFTNLTASQVLTAYIQRLEERVARHFVMTGASQRDAERVTAVEIERDIRELEAGLGGVFTHLTATMLEWRTRLLIARMKQRGEFPRLTEGVLNPVILTGLEALARERDVGNTMRAAEMLAGFSPEERDWVKPDVILGRGMAGLGFTDSIRPATEVTRIRQDRAALAAIQQGVGGAIPKLAEQGAEVQ